MTISITPNGTRGREIPRLPRPLMTVAMALFSLSMRLRGRKLLTLTTVGSRTGQTHTIELSWFADGERWLIVASAGGSARHPGWFYNLARNPDKVWITLGGRKIKVRPESLEGDDYRRTFDRIQAAAPGFRDYEASTDRRIPVIRLTEESSPQGA